MCQYFLSPWRSKRSLANTFQGIQQFQVRSLGNTRQSRRQQLMVGSYITMSGSLSLFLCCAGRVNSEGLGLLARVFFVTQPSSISACGRDKKSKNTTIKRVNFKSLMHFGSRVFLTKLRNLSSQTLNMFNMGTLSIGQKIRKDSSFIAMLKL